MKQKGYLIGEVSRATGISKDTLHFYNKIGLLVPDCVDEANGYRYYSLRNLWQLDIITTCRKLDIPLETVREILAQRDNGEIVKLLMAHREEALRLSEYYRQVAGDILWYGEEHQRVAQQDERFEIRVEWLEEETVVAGDPASGDHYHIQLQTAARDTLRSAPSIRRKYGYVLDPEPMAEGKFVKRREYLKVDDLTHTAPEHQYTLPAGRYACCTIRVRNEAADFTPFLNWLEEHGERIDVIFAEEIGLQLFPYMDAYDCEIKARLISEK